MSDQDAPQVTGPSPDASTLGSIVGNSPPPMPALNEQGTGASQDDSQMSRPTSRLTAILSAVAHVATVGMSGIPAGNRPSFLGGLGQGARASLADQSAQQAIKFKTFDDSMRAAQMHNDDLRLQN